MAFGDDPTTCLAPGPRGQVASPWQAHAARSISGVGIAEPFDRLTIPARSMAR
jgi:hypothetical protein